MKITGYSNSLRVTLNSGRDIGALLKGISVGDRVPARIVSREGNIALLDLAGRRIRAEFTGGIPEGNTVDLILSEKGKKSAVFRLPAADSTSRLTEFLKQFFMTGVKTADRAMIAELLRFISGKSTDLGEINIFLAGMKKDQPKEKKFSDLINRLISLNVPEQTLSDLGLMAAMKLPAPLFSAILFLMEKTGRKREFAADNERLDDILRDVEEWCDDGLFAQLLEFLAGPQMKGEGYGSLPFPGGEEFTGFDFIFKEDMFFMSFSLSALGRISLFIRMEKGRASLSIGAENDRAVAMLEKDYEELAGSLKRSGTEFDAIRFFNTKKVIDKLRVLCSDFQLKSGIDVKI